ncbi:MAG TPA: hypothetical protein VG838_17170 [Opitutaceae bacterium]|nr:hypothetical protein [Opitutaceae bacterium]
MKTIALLALALAGLAPAQAQIFHPAGFRGHGAAVSWHSDRGWGYRGGPSWGIGFYGLAPWGYGYYGYRAPVYYTDYGYNYDSGYAYDTGYYAAAPSYQASGTWLGAIAGAILGRNSGSLGHSAWRGAAYGAGAGLLLGTVADINARARAATAPRAIAAPPVAPASSGGNAPVTIINNYYNAPATPMGAANGLFGR